MVVNDVFRALADPNRRRLLDLLHERNGQTLRELCEHLDMSRQAVTKHLLLLQACNLLTTVRRPGPSFRIRNGLDLRANVDPTPRVVQLRGHGTSCAARA